MPLDSAPLQAMKLEQLMGYLFLLIEGVMEESLCVSTLRTRCCGAIVNARRGWTGKRRL